MPDDQDVYPNNPLADVPESIEVVCDVKGGRTRFLIDRVKPNWKEVWNTPLPQKRGAFGPTVYCESYGGRLEPVSGIEQALNDADKKPDKYTLRIPYEQCVEHGTNWTMNEWPVGDGQVKEAQQALLLCPNHPDAAAIRSRIADVGVLQTAIKEGRAFGDGNYRVGTGVQPGTYFTENVENCYWERLDSAGNIIDNNFISSGLRVEATISASDFSFHAEGCGMWRQVA
ncbi:hypothetical protein [Nocardioides sp. zg-1230]|uniref:hypothetical protein n=1 Tax=Nocardioides sp. zg-1230 TaxID=2736601 RepID=UPI001553A6AA|nr:hypothetical protein [Nocardioides sp. zg-1230]NPC43124.1 hypothetical protein [Nocardioides sp. zg-1230]